MKATAVIAHLPAGSGRKPKVNFESQQDYFNNSPGIFTIENNDNLCGLRAIIIAMAFESKNTDLKAICKRHSP